MTYDLVTIGETMICLQSFEGSQIQYSNLFRKSIAGAESNVAIATSRLSHKVKWFSSLGLDAHGRTIYNTIINENVHAEIHWNESKNTGIFFKDYKGYGETAVIYYRANSAASVLPDTLINEFFKSNSLIKHLTGVTLALSLQNRENIYKQLQVSKFNGKISFDPNIRLKLWSKKEARDSILKILPFVDYYFPSNEEFRLLHGVEASESSMCKIANEYNLELIVVKTGMGGMALCHNTFVQFDGELSSNVKDTAGAGDAFVSGALSYILDHKYHIVDMKRMLTQAHEMGRTAVQFESDWEGLPGKNELNQLLNGGISDNR